MTPRRSPIASPGRRLLPGLLALAAVLLTPPPAGVAQAAAAGGDEPPTSAAAPAPDAPEFWLEMITVRGAKRISTDLIVSESLLTTGRAYREDELRQAVYRVQRLPFVLAADLSLARGSERGRYELVITVVETRRFFFGAGVITSRVEPETTFGLEDNGFLLAGVRLFAGRYGVVYAALGGEETGVGYTRYRLFGRPALLDVLVGRSICTVGRDPVVVIPDNSCLSQVLPLGLDPTLSVWNTREGSDRARLSLRLPVRGDHSIRFAGSLLRSDEGSRSPALSLRNARRFFSYRDFRQGGAEVAWVYDTSDDPLFPTRGLEWSAGLGYGTLAADLTLLDSSSTSSERLREVRLPEARSWQLLASGAVERHWPLGSRQALSIGARAALGRGRVEDFPLETAPSADPRVGDADLDVWQSRVELRHAMALRRRRSEGRRSDLWWETTGAYSYDGTSPDFAAAANPLAQFQLTSGLALRNSWGIFRLGFTYLEVEVDR